MLLGNDSRTSAGKRTRSPIVLQAKKAGHLSTQSTTQFGAQFGVTNSIILLSDEIEAPNGLVRFWSTMVIVFKHEHDLWTAEIKEFDSLVFGDSMEAVKKALVADIAMLCEELVGRDDLHPETSRVAKALAEKVKEAYLIDAHS